MKMKTFRIALIVFFLSALAIATVFALDTNYIPDYFEACEDLEEDPYQEQCGYVSEAGYYLETSCGMAILGYRMYQLSFDEVPLFCCYYTGCSNDRCYEDYVTHIYPYLPYE